jgi:hypothetical protein
MTHLSRVDRATIAAEPWLQPWVESDDANLAPARRRYWEATASAKDELRDGAEQPHHRMLTSSGLETTSLTPLARKTDR